MTLPNIKIKAKADSKDAANVINKLIDKISNAIGTVYEPKHLVRVAKSQSQARIIAAETEAIIPNIQQRAIERFHRQETRKQKNLEHTIELAQDLLKPSAKPEQMDDDWLNEWIERAARISDEDLQSLWARILAGEANSPHSFRKSLLHTVSILEKSDADNFANLCRFVVNLDEPIPFIFEPEDNIYNNEGIYFSTISDLEAIGLIFFDSSGGYSLKNMPQRFQFSYGTVLLNFVLPDDCKKLSIGKVRFTNIGSQLFPLTNPKPISTFPKYIVDHYEKTDVKLTTSTIHVASMSK